MVVFSRDEDPREKNGRLLRSRLLLSTYSAVHHSIIAVISRKIVYWDIKRERRREAASYGRKMGLDEVFLGWGSE